MKLPRRKLLRLAAGAVAFPSLLRFASAFDYPTRPVHLIVGFPPGGVNDLMARMIGQALLQPDVRFGQKRTFRRPVATTALPPKADMVQHDRDVRFVPEADVCKDKNHVG